MQSFRYQWTHTHTHTLSLSLTHTHPHDVDGLINRLAKSCAAHVHEQGAQQFLFIPAIRDKSVSVSVCLCLYICFCISLCIFTLRSLSRARLCVLCVCVCVCVRTLVCFEHVAVLLPASQALSVSICTFVLLKRVGSQYETHCLELA